MVDLLLAAGADPTREWRWVTPLAYARVFASRPVIEARGVPATLSREEALMA